MELNRIQPPKLAMRLFKWYCRTDRFEELSGDLEEMYELRRMKWPKWKADAKVWWDVLTCYRSYARRSGYLMETSGALYVSYLKLSIRKMYTNKGMMVVNVLGLSFALAFCVVTYMFYGYNREFDTHFDSSDVFRIHGIRDGESITNRYELTPLALENALKESHSAVKDVVSYLVANINLGKGRSFFPTTLGFVSPSFPEVFRLPMKEGGASDLALQGVFLTESTAKKLFGNEPAMGQNLSLFYFGEKMPDVTVTGVIADPPVNSSFTYEGLLNIESLLTSFGLERNTWNTKGFQFGQYVQLISPDARNDVNKHLQSFIEAHNQANENRKVSAFDLVPFVNRQLNSNEFISYTNSRISDDELMIMSTIAVLILFVACFNMANTQIALMARRVKEIGVRKTMGSSNRQVFFQFIFEMFLIMSLSIIVAIFMTNIIASQVWAMYGKEFLLQHLDLTGVVMFLVSFLLLLTVLTGLIPALYARNFQPVSIINHKLKLKGLRPVHYLLMVAQYSFAVALMFCGLSFMSNATFMQTRDFGYDPDNLMVIRVKDDKELSALKNELNQQSFTSQTFSSYHYLSGYSFRSVVKVDEADLEIGHYQVGANYLTNMGVRFQMGRDFIDGSNTDIDNHVVVNRQFADSYFGGNALHQTVKVGDKTRTIIGVLEDYQDGELFSWYAPVPLVFTMAAEEKMDFLFLRTNGEQNSEVLASVEDVWQQLFQRPLVYHWQHDFAYAGTVKNSRQMRDIFFWMTAMALLLSMVGIIALAGIQIESRIKEISIRKVLGATVREVMMLVNRPFAIILSVSIVIGTGLGYNIAEAMMESIFSVHEGISILSGTIVGLLLFFVTLFVVTLAVYRPASANPADGLRTE